MIPRITEPCEGMRTCCLKTDRFRTNRFTVSFLLPKSAQRIAAEHLLTALLTNSCARYPDFTAFGRRLAMLYGAHVSGETTDLGDAHALRFSVDYLADRFTLGGESIAAQCAQLLCTMIFEPRLTGGLFDEKEFASEQRQLLEDVQAKINDKIGYARSRMWETMFAGSPCGLPEAGGEDAVRAVTNRQVVEAWEHMLRTGEIVLFYVGDRDPEECFGVFDRYLSAVERQPVPVAVGHEPLGERPVNTLTESMDLVQGKLVLGMRTNVRVGDPMYFPMRTAIDLWGGGVYSLLFTKVREQMSLCYYCSARYHPLVGAAVVNSGIETENFEKARDAILAQLSDLQAGNFDDSILQSSQRSFSNLMKTLYDSPATLDAWYFMRIAEKTGYTVESFCEQILSVTREQVIEAAGNIQLDTVYLLRGKEEAHE